MSAGLVGIGLVRVARGTIDRLGGQIVVRVFGGQVSVATHARVRAVDRVGIFAGIDEQRNGFALRVCLGQGLVRVAFETVAVRRGLGHGLPAGRHGRWAGCGDS